jgi:glycosyltransferase involved in cell wall biosynthesis
VAERNGYQVTTHARLLVVQPYVPQYRVPFFEAAHARLAELGIDLTVAAPRPESGQDERHDAADTQTWHVESRLRQVRVPSVATFSSLGSTSMARKYDAVIAPASATIVDALLLAFHPRPRQRVGLWGHIGAYVKDPRRIDVVIETRMLRRVDTVLAYTESGGDAARRAGVSDDAIFVLNNTIDTSALIAGPTDHSDLKVPGDWDPQRTFGYLGGLDASKDVGFLARVLDEAWIHAPSVRVLVAGRGCDEHHLDRAAQRGQVKRLGFVGAAEKRAMGVLCRALINPGRIGLVAVDALALDLPLITRAAWSHHAPEADYLVRGSDLFEVQGSAYSFAQFLGAFERADGRLAPPPNLGDMVSSFVDASLRLTRA